MTNMDMLTIPSAGGVDSTTLIVGDFSNGNDGVVLKAAEGSSPTSKVRRSIWSSSRCRIIFWFVRSAPWDCGNVTSDGEHLGRRHRRRIQRTFDHLRGDMEAPTQRDTGSPQAHLVFDSSKIPGEILDLMVVNSAILTANPKLGKR